MLIRVLEINFLFKGRAYVKINKIKFFCFLKKNLVNLQEVFRLELLYL
jgi:hypothetical protein